MLKLIRKKGDCQMKTVLSLTLCMFLTMHLSIQCTLQEFKGTSAQLKAKLQEGKPVVIKFYQPWCPACKHFAPTFETIAQEYPTIKFIDVNCSDNKEVADAYAVTAYPTLMYYDADGKIIDKKSGILKPDEFRQKIKTIITN